MAAGQPALLPPRRASGQRQRFVKGGGRGNSSHQERHTTRCPAPQHPSKQQGPTTKRYHVAAHLLSLGSTSSAAPTLRRSCRFLQGQGSPAPSSAPGTAFCNEHTSCPTLPALHFHVHLCDQHELQSLPRAMKWLVYTDVRADTSLQKAGQEASPECCETRIHPTAEDAQLGATSRMLPARNMSCFALQSQLHRSDMSKNEHMGAKAPKETELTGNKSRVPQSEHRFFLVSPRRWLFERI